MWNLSLIRVYFVVISISTYNAIYVIDVYGARKRHAILLLDDYFLVVAVLFFRDNSSVFVK